MNLSYQELVRLYKSDSVQKSPQTNDKPKKLVRKDRQCCWCGNKLTIVNDPEKNFCSFERDQFGNIRKESCRQLYRYMMDRIIGKSQVGHKRLQNKKVKEAIEIILWELIERNPARPLNEQLKLLCKKRINKITIA
jgi:hypothetical protein